MKDEIKILKALGDETRLKIIEFIKNDEKCACKIIPGVRKSQPSVSSHLKILSEAGILESRKEGTRIYYKIKDKRVIDIMRILSGEINL